MKENTYTIFTPDYECPNEIATFKTKELAIDFIRLIYPDYIILDIDKEDKEKSKHGFSCDCFIRENVVLFDIPKAYLTLSVSFNDYEDSNETTWFPDYRIEIENEDINDSIISEEKHDLYFQKTILFDGTEKADVLLQEYFETHITEEMKEYRGAVKLPNGDFVLKSNVFVGGDTIKSVNNNTYDKKYVLDALSNDWVITNNNGIIKEIKIDTE